jgi:D-glycero-D-manno-heptose 1,7-bisphosphate phosphatase
MNQLNAPAIRYVFLDRDGVLNRKRPEGEYVTRWSEFEWLPGAEEAIARMNRAHLTVILITNQRGIALGILSEAELEQIHRKMQSDLAEHGAHLDAIYYCPHDYGQCDCRKPDIGLFKQAMQQFASASPQQSVVIGDSLPDIEAGKRLGMKTIFLKGEPERQKKGSQIAAEEADAVAASLLEAVEAHLQLGPANSHDK